ncbi:hypothetical protein I7860_20260 [Pseudomonas tolaasii]|uniref:hypothetical protein n=1 Tax=Pseudomonas tolaasii TaxID=29442 RepID=UPI001C59A553|nr:hypothetical protein [Pseudomonas tolaasii]MBW1249015.1 hypothetical protein [Pseudomonas tolaasii]
MSEVHRYKVVKMLSEDGNRISYDPHGPEVVLASAFDGATRLFLDAAERAVASERREKELQQRLTAADEREEVLERDAARYRWLRDASVGPHMIDRLLFQTISDDCNPPYRDMKHGVELDTAIDAELKPADADPCCTVSAEDRALLDAGDYTPEELFGVVGKPSCTKCAP